MDEKWGDRVGCIAVAIHMIAILKEKELKKNKKTNKINEKTQPDLQRMCPQPVGRQRKDTVWLADS